MAGVLRPEQRSACCWAPPVPESEAPGETECEDAGLSIREVREVRTEGHGRKDRALRQGTVGLARGSDSSMLDW